MAFKGDLNNISLFDVFQTLSQNKQTGVLVLQREGCAKKIHISPEGVRVFFARSFRPLRLGEIFVKRGRITTQDIEILLLEQKKEYRPIGQLLVESGKIDEEELNRTLRYHAEDEIFEAFAWEVGSFAFYDGQEATETQSPLSDILMDPASLCLEAARRLDEMERLRETIPCNDEFFIQQEGLAPDREANSQAVLDVFDHLGEPQCIDELRDMVGLSLYDTLVSVSRLVSGGLARCLTVDELIATSERARDIGGHARAAQLLELAHGREPSDRAILDQCVEAVQRIQEPKRLARLLCAAGTLSLDTDEVDEAVEYLEQALRHDSSLFEAMLAIRDAFARQDDRERVAETSLKMARAHVENGNLDGALEACDAGLQDAPQAVTLRYYYAQLLMRGDRYEDAREEIIELVQTTESSRKAMRSEKALELLASCYRLLLKIDPEDEDAIVGLKTLESVKIAGGRKRKNLIRAAVAAALLAVVGVVGLSFRGPGPGVMMEELAAAHQAGNDERALQLIQELRKEHPDSDEATSAGRIKAAIDKKRATKNTARKVVQDRLRREIDERLNEVRAALQDKPYLEALDLLPPFLQQLDQRQVAFLRKGVTSHLEYDLINFLEGTLKRFKDDRQQLAISQHQLQQLKDGGAEKLNALERQLAHVRSRDWIRLVPDLCERLADVAKSKHIGKGSKGIKEFIDEIKGAEGAFTNLDALFFAVRAARLKAEIIAVRDLADRQGREYMRTCEVEKAHELYARAYDKAHEVDRQQPRKYFLDLLTWLERSNILRETRRRRNELVEVISQLAEVETLRRENQPHAAYRVLRNLFSKHRLIRFEAKYRMPYRVLSTPKGAVVYLDEKEVGMTPCEIEMDFVPQARIRVERKGFHTKETKLLPTDPANTGTLDIKLEKKLAWDHEISGLIEAAPVIAKGKLLLATNRSTLQAIDLAGGGVAWEAATNTLDRITAAPVVVGDWVYLTTAPGKVYRVRLKDGDIAPGHLQLDGKVSYTAALHKKTLWVATSTPALYAIRDGKVVSRTPLGAAPSAALVAAGNEIYIPTAARGQILVHDAKTGKQLRRLTAPSGTSFFGGICVKGNRVFAGGEDGRLWAFDRRTGAVAWKTNTSGPVTAHPVPQGDLVMLSTRGGVVRGLTQEGKVEVTFEVGFAIDHTPAITDGFLYVIASQHIAAFDAVEERAWWDYDFKDETPQYIVAGEGYIVVITDKPWIHTFERDQR